MSLFGQDLPKNHLADYICDNCAASNEYLRYVHVGILKVQSCWTQQNAKNPNPNVGQERNQESRAVCR